MQRDIVASYFRFDFVADSHFVVGQLVFEQAFPFMLLSQNVL